MPRVKTIDYLKFMDFWLYEYIRRGERRNRCKTEGVYVNGAPANPYRNADEMIQDINTDGIDIHRVGLVDNRDMISAVPIQFLGVVGREEAMSNISDCYDGALEEELFVIDIKKPITEIVADIKFWYSALKADPDRLNNELLQDWFRSKEARLREMSGMIRLPKQENRYLPRAVGLWLWDYLKEHNMSWVNRARAFKPFHDKYHHGDPQKGPYLDKYQEDSQLEKFLRITDECIRKMKVLPMG